MKKRGKMKTRWISILLCMSMLLADVPVTVFADGETETASVTETQVPAESESETETKVPTESESELETKVPAESESSRRRMFLQRANQSRNQMQKLIQKAVII